MKHRLFIHIILIFACSLLLIDKAVGQDSTNIGWIASTALTLPKGRLEKGFFQPLRYGINEETEISTHLLGNVLNPNIGIKYKWTAHKGFVFSSFHKLSHPTPLLKAISRRGPGGLMPATTQVPFFINFQNRLMASYVWKSGNILTQSLSYHYALSNGVNSMVTIDYPMLYPRTNIYLNYYSVRFDTDFILNIKSIGEKRRARKFICSSTPWHHMVYKGSVSIFLTEPEGNSGSLFLEHKGLFMMPWKFTNLFRPEKESMIQLGYLVTYGKYPFGKDLSVFPVIDIVWGRNLVKQDTDPTN